MSRKATAPPKTRESRPATTGRLPKISLPREEQFNTTDTLRQQRLFNLAGLTPSFAGVVATLCWGDIA